MIVAFEGIDGAGKNTLVQALIREIVQLEGIDSAATMSFPRYQESIHAQLAADALHGKMGDLVDSAHGMAAVSYTHLTLPTILRSCRSRWSPYH